jgi:hypothetical protein
VVGNFISLSSAIDKSRMQKEHQEVHGKPEQLHHQLDQTVIYRIAHLITEDFTFFSSSQEKPIKTGHILSHKTYVMKYKMQVSLPF